MGRLLNESNGDKNQHIAAIRRQESSAESTRHLPYKRPSIIPLYIFEVLLNFALTLMPQDRAVFLTVTHWFVGESSNEHMIILFCVRFVTKDILQPFKLYQLRNDPNIAETMGTFWKLFIEDLSILNLKVIGSISIPCDVVAQVLNRFNKEQDMTNGFVYTILPFKNIVHIFCSKTLYTDFNGIIGFFPYIYFISVDSDESEGVVYNGIKLSCAQSGDMIKALTDNAKNSSMHSGLEATLEQGETTRTVKVAQKIIKYVRNFKDSITKYSDITPDRFVQIVNENSDFIRFSATAKFSMVEIKESDVFKPSISPYDYYTVYRKLLSMPPILQEKTGFPLNPYHLLSKDVGWYFMKPSGYVGKRSEGLRQEIARRANVHRRNSDDARGISKSTAGKLLNDSETHSSVKDESDELYEIANGKQTWIKDVFIKECQNVQTLQSLNKHTENGQAFSIATDLVTIVLRNAENIAESRQDAYNHLMSLLVPVAIPSPMFRYWIASFKCYLKLHDQMLKYNIKSIRADTLDLTMPAAYISNAITGQTSCGKVLVYPTFNQEAVDVCRLYINDENPTS